MPRLRQPIAKKDDGLFDSTKVQKPVEEQPEPPPKIVRGEGGWEPEKEPQDEPEVIVEEPKEPERVEAKEPKKDDASLALKRQLDQIREIEAARVRANEERDRALKQQMRAQRDTIEAQEIALDKTIQAAHSEAEKALLDYKNADNAGDIDAKAEAIGRITDAKASMRFFEEKKEILKEQKRELKKERQKAKEAQEAQPQQQQQDPRELPHIAAWRNAHQEYFTDPIKDAELRVAFLKSQKEGFVPYSPEQVERIDELLGLKQSKQEVQPERRTSYVSAPVSREVPTASGRREGGTITLTKEQAEFARISGVTPAEYARQLKKMREMQANGELQGDRR